MDKDEKQTKAQLNKLVDYLAQLTANPTQTRDDLWKFAKHHDRRSYILMRFCMADESDYRKVHKSIVCQPLLQGIMGICKLTIPTERTFETVQRFPRCLIDIFKQHIEHPVSDVQPVLQQESSPTHHRNVVT